MFVFSSYYLFIVYMLIVTALIAISSGDKDIPQKDENIAAFYHTTVTKNQRYLEIAEAQIKYLNESGLLSRLKAVYYGVIHPRQLKSGKKFIIKNDKFINVGYWSSGYEMKTLGKLYKFCRHNPTYKVLYFHLKGAQNQLEINNLFRSVIEVFTLHTSCISVLDTHDTCGWRLSPMPYIHYSGNFWWARCSYINTLIDPDTMYVDSPKHLEMIAETMKYFKTPSTHTSHSVVPLQEKMAICVGLMRFFAEAWVGSAPYLNGADCLSNNTEPTYLYGYGMKYVDFIRMKGLADSYRNNNSKVIECGPAATNVSYFSFNESYYYNLRNQECSHVQTYINRTRMWYNDIPHSLIDWRRKFGEFIPNF